jgi:UDP-N-acetylmuramoyl-L-alanyl-D-glutamate--2,6-diaminopimelate ligase
VGALTGSLRPQHPQARVVQELVSAFGLGGDEVPTQLVATGMTMATGEVRSGDIFVALPGANLHGAQFARDAVAAGAVAIVTDAAGAQAAAGCGVPIVVTDHVRARMGAMAAWMYGTTELAIPTFGVTGTNGKTSVVYLLTAILAQLGISSGLSTTAERRIGQASITSGLTTPESTQLHALIARMADEQVGAVALEVSAQALSRHRIDGVHFDVVGFTNLSHDHFDDYVAFEDYFEAKSQLFTLERAGRGVVIADDTWGERLATQARIPITTITTNPDIAADWRLVITCETQRETNFRLTAVDGRSLETSVPVMGRFMAANAALAIVMLLEAGHALADIASALERDSGIAVHIPGRAEIVSGERGPVVYVDYGHTPDAFEVLLSSLQAVTAGKVVMVFGADGDRDTTKRHEMGAIAARGADIVIITDFHPRTEDPALIRQALLEGARAAASGADIMEEADPQLAMRLAIKLAGEDDAIVYAGPGHEDYREVNGVHLDYNAREDVRAALREAGLPPLGEN